MSLKDNKVKMTMYYRYFSVIVLNIVPSSDIQEHELASLISQFRAIFTNISAITFFYYMAINILRHFQLFVAQIHFVSSKIQSLLKWHNVTDCPNASSEEWHVLYIFKASE